MHTYRRLLLLLMFLAVLLVAFQVSGLREHFDLAYLRQHLLDNLFSGLLIFILLFALGNLLHVPGWVFLAAAVLALGRGWGGLATYLAAVISCAVTFFTIRWVGGDALRLLRNRLIVRVLSHLDQHPLASVAVLRMCLATSPQLNYALALSGVPFRHYLLGTLVGLPLPILFYCLFFDYLARAMQISQ